MFMSGEIKEGNENGFYWGDTYFEVWTDGAYHFAVDDRQEMVKFLEALTVEGDGFEGGARGLVRRALCVLKGYSGKSAIVDSNHSASDLVRVFTQSHGSLFDGYITLGEEEE